jgi:hypothetical protein
MGQVATDGEDGGQRNAAQARRGKFGANDWLDERGHPAAIDLRIQ